MSSIYSHIKQALKTLIIKGLAMKRSVQKARVGQITIILIFSALGFAACGSPVCETISELDTACGSALNFSGTNSCEEKIREECNVSVRRELETAVNCLDKNLQCQNGGTPLSNTQINDVISGCSVSVAGLDSSCQQALGSVTVRGLESGTQDSTQTAETATSSY